tara:strand:- start:1043 stop:1858 length:816 start_codon:yes stop_codon:yes gene_type:complete
MDFFEINHPIKKIGQDKYVIGKQALEPLVLIEGKKIQTEIGQFKNILSDSSTAISGFAENSFIDNLVLQTGIFQNISGEVFRSIRGFTENSFIDNLVLQTGIFQDISGETFYSEKGSSQAFYVSGINIAESLIKVSGDLISTGLHLHEHIDSLSGDLVSTRLHLHEHIDSLSGDLISTGLHLHEHIENLEERINNANSNTGISLVSGNYKEQRFLLEEAFEEDELGDIVPTNHPFISDPMWILKGDNDLELRANVWRYDTGPEAFTKDISF